VSISSKEFSNELINWFIRNAYNYESYVKQLCEPLFDIVALGVAKDV